jgi:hypothetical protein
MVIVWVSDLESSNFLQDQGNQAFEGGVVFYAAHSNAQIDAEIAEKGGFRTETNSGPQGL